ncbi:uncharacterized protein DS421_10g309190 [Arachis hypogaea]|nr:uncharacterized protein DS421_10g309190 [Arachis hypogaea]
MKLDSFLAVTELVPLMVSAEIATSATAVGVRQDLALAFALITCNLGGLATTSSYISQYKKYLLVYKTKVIFLLHFLSDYTTCCVAWVGGMLSNWLMSISVGGWMGAESEGNGGIASEAVSCSTRTTFTSRSAPSVAGATTASCSYICLACFRWCIGLRWNCTVLTGDLLKLRVGFDGLRRSFHGLSCGLAGLVGWKLGFFGYLLG